MKDTRTSRGEIKILTIPLAVTNNGPISVDLEESITSIQKILDLKNLQDSDDVNMRLKRMIFRRYLGNIVKFARNQKWLSETVNLNHSNINTYIEYPFRHINELEEYLNPNRTEENELQSYIMAFIHDIRGSLFKLDFYCFEPILILKKILNEKQKNALETYFNKGNKENRISLENTPNAHIFHILKKLKSSLEDNPLTPQKIPTEDTVTISKIVQKYEQICKNPRHYIPKYIGAEIKKIREKRVTYSECLIEIIVEESLEIFWNKKRLV